MKLGQKNLFQVLDSFFLCQAPITSYTLQRVYKGLRIDVCLWKHLSTFFLPYDPLLGRILSPQKL